MTAIYNLITDPRFTGGQWTGNGVVIGTDANHELSVQNDNSNDAFVKLILSDVSAYRGVSMTLACSLSMIPASAQECGNGLMLVLGSTVLGNCTDGGTARTGRKTLQFTIPQDTGSLEVRLYGPAVDGSMFQWWRPILTRTVDYQRLLNGIGDQPMDYFDGDTMPWQ